MDNLQNFSLSFTVLLPLPPSIYRCGIKNQPVCVGDQSPTHEEIKSCRWQDFNQGRVNHHATMTWIESDACNFDVIAALPPGPDSPAQCDVTDGAVLKNHSKKTR
uniref:Uncharacterized protein n=1 Tax=Lygus hesperus TaxID=30085 RepID=A0A0K8SFG2_LYGHE